MTESDAPAIPLISLQLFDKRFFNDIAETQLVLQTVCDFIKYKQY